jgi:undecaprenyl-diphosphatase
MIAILSFEPMTIDRRHLIVTVALVIALGLSAAAAFTRTFPGDSIVSRWVQDLGASSWMDPTMGTISRLGGVVPLVLLLLATSLVLHARAHHAQLAVPAMAISGAAIVPLLKFIVDRPRPTAEVVDSLYPVGGLSFPSGHAFTAVAMLGAVFYLARRLCGPNRYAVLALRAAIGVLILTIGISRIYLGVHWASDILGGYVMGGLTLYAVIKGSEAAARRLGAESPEAALPPAAG